MEARGEGYGGGAKIPAVMGLSPPTDDGSEGSPALRPVEAFFGDEGPGDHNLSGLSLDRSSEEGEDRDEAHGGRALQC